MCTGFTVRPPLLLPSMKGHNIPCISTLIVCLISFCDFYFDVLFIWQHHYEAGESPGEGGPPVERDIHGLCTLSVTHPAGQPWARVAHRRYRCCVVHFIPQAVCVESCSPSPYHCVYYTGCLIDGCIHSRRCWQESHYFAHKLGVCHILIKSAFPFIHLVTSVCFVFFMILSTYWGLFRYVVFLNISVSQSQQMLKCWNNCRPFSRASDIFRI